MQFTAVIEIIKALGQEAIMEIVGNELVKGSIAAAILLLGIALFIKIVVKALR